jgi:hypothetical protein
MSTTIALDDLRRELPRGPEPKSALDRIVEQLATAGWPLFDLGALEYEEVGTMKFEKLLRDSVVAQFGPQIEAGLYDEKYPALKQLWLEDTAAKCEAYALRNACAEVSENYSTLKD